MTLSLSTRLTMNDGHSIPQLGFGVYKVDVGDTVAAVTTALDAGYRHIDTAALYRNETEVGRAVRESGVPRDEVFVTTKVWNDRQGYDETLRAFDESAEKLDLGVIDLYLVHWPQPARNLYIDTYRALLRLREEGRVRSIGVSNFTPAHIKRVVEETGDVPAINQVELHPRLAQPAVRAFGAEHGILTEAWAPLGRGTVLDDPALVRIAGKHGVSPAQVVVRWHLQLGTVVIPKSVTPERIRANADVYGFALDADDLATISALEAGQRTGKNPDTFNEV